MNIRLLMMPRQKSTNGVKAARWKFFPPQYTIRRHLWITQNRTFQGDAHTAALLFHFSAMLSIHLQVRSDLALLKSFEIRLPALHEAT